MYFGICFKRTLQRWRHKFVFFNSWHSTLCRRLMFHLHITFNQFYCFAKFQCNCHSCTFYRPEQFSGTLVCEVGFIPQKKSKINAGLRFLFFPAPCKFQLKKLIIAVTMSSSVFLTSSFISVNNVRIFTLKMMLVASKLSLS